MANRKKHGIKSLCDNKNDVEMGSSRRKDAKPFIRPALENHIDKYQRIITKHLKDA